MTTTTPTTALVVPDDAHASAALEHILATGDLAQLTPAQRVGHYLNQCRSLGLNPISRPFDWLILDDRLVLYPNKSCAEQLRRAHQISVKVLRREVVGDLFVCEVEGRTPLGRTDQASKYVPLTGYNGRTREPYRLTGTNLANAFAKAETGAKRRLVLSMVGLSTPPDPDELQVSTYTSAAGATITARFVVVDGSGNVLTNPTQQERYLAETPAAARAIGAPTFETTATADDDPGAAVSRSQAPQPSELEQPQRPPGPRSTLGTSPEDVKRLLGAWFASVKGSSLDDDDARHRFVGQWTASEGWPRAKQTESLRTFFARATADEAAQFLAHVRALVEDEKRANAEALASLHGESAADDETPEEPF